MTFIQLTDLSLSQLAADHLAAKVLAAAICMKCPKAQIVKARAESYGFCCEFYSNESLSETFLSFLEEGMHSILLKNEIKILEMLRDNAIEFLNFHHQKRKAKELKEWVNGLVKVIKIESYVDLLEEEFELEEASQSLKAFKLISISTGKEKNLQGQDKVLVRIKGVSSSGQGVLREFVKKVKEASKQYHLNHSELFSLVKSEEGEGFLWHSEGVQLKNNLVNILKKPFKDHGYQEVGFAAVENEVGERLCLKSLSSFMYLYDQSTELDFYEEGLGLYSLETTQSISLVKGYGSEALEASVSFLIKSLYEIMEVLKLDCTASFKENREQKRNSKVDFQELFKKILPTLECGDLSHQKDYNVFLSLSVKDSFEREWEIATVEIEDKKSPCYVRMTLISIERWIALLLDHSKESLLTLRSI